MNNTIPRYAAAVTTLKTTTHTQPLPTGREYPNLTPA